VYSYVCVYILCIYPSGTELRTLSLIRCFINSLIVVRPSTLVLLPLETSVVVSEHEVRVVKEVVGHH
jgi:hypothetical protein